MKKRTARFGWTKKFQRRIETARKWLNLSLSLTASNPDASRHLRTRAENETRNVHADHRCRVIALRRRQA